MAACNVDIFKDLDYINYICTIFGLYRTMVFCDVIDLMEMSFSALGIGSSITEKILQFYILKMQYLKNNKKHFNGKCALL